MVIVPLPCPRPATAGAAGATERPGSPRCFAGPLCAGGSSCLGAPPCLDPRLVSRPLSSCGDAGRALPEPAGRWATGGGVIGSTARLPVVRSPAAWASSQARRPRACQSQSSS
jgi:hypothetical protein